MHCLRTIELPNTIPDLGPGQGDDMLDILIEALDGDDLRRTALVMRAVYLKMDLDRDDDLTRTREATASVFRPI